MAERKAAINFRSAGTALQARHQEIAVANRTLGWCVTNLFVFHDTIKTYCSQFVKVEFTNYKNCCIATYSWRSPEQMAPIHHEYGRESTTGEWIRADITRQPGHRAANPPPGK
ncbi:MAG: hypothetical protein ACRDFX_08175 [Chloroflexota bacterium]